jgi:2-polyprenyl-3-methyl-5-hydroxy-6-metoxy-1,4-benzoquinol methylase
MNDGLKLLLSDDWYSLRRYFVDDFFTRNIGHFRTGASILDMGGKKKGKRGRFDIGKYPLQVRYANIEPSTEPDYLCDIISVPEKNESFDGVILSEVLEHVPDPGRVLSEAVRLLRPGGCLLLCTPFHFQVHADPLDFGRYTDEWYRTTLSALACTNISIEKQGLFFAVCANMLKQFFLEARLVNKPQNRLLRWMVNKFARWFIRNSFRWDQKPFVSKNAVLGNYTTGFGVVCYKL